MPTSPFDPSKLNRNQRYEFRKRYPKAADKYFGPSNMMGVRPTNIRPQANLFGSPPAGPQTQRTGAIVAGEMIPSEAAPFGYRNGQPLRGILPYPEMKRMQEEKLAEKEAKEYSSDYIFSKMPVRFGSDLQKASQNITSAFNRGDISASQARSIADRVMAYYDNKTQQELFSELTGGGSPVQEPAPKPVRTRAQYYGNVQDYGQPGDMFSKNLEVTNTFV